MLGRSFAVVLALLIATPAGLAAGRHGQDTGFLNRTVTVRGVARKYVVYLPEEWTSDHKWPMVLFLHGSGERGSEGLDETQIGLPAAIRVHPERWPFVVVMPQVPFSHHHWTDPTYLTGRSLGGYGTWELAREYPHTFAAIAPVCGGIFWSYAPARWSEQTTLPDEYARALRHVPVWEFHGADDPVVSPRQSALMFDALKLENGNVRYWEYAGVKHSVWEKAYADPALPQWLLAHTLTSDTAAVPGAEHLLIPVHPVPAKINPAVYDAYAGEYEDAGVVQTTVYRVGDQLFQRNRIGEVTELLPENANTFFFPSGSTTRLIFTKDAETGFAREVVVRDDRHEERWERKR